MEVYNTIVGDTKRRSVMGQCGLYVRAEVEARPRHDPTELLRHRLIIAPTGESSFAWRYVRQRSFGKSQ